VTHWLWWRWRVVVQAERERRKAEEARVELIARQEAATAAKVKAEEELMEAEALPRRIAKIKADAAAAALWEAGAGERLALQRQVCACSGRAHSSTASRDCTPSAACLSVCLSVCPSVCLSVSGLLRADAGARVAEVIIVCLCVWGLRRPGAWGGAGGRRARRAAASRLEAAGDGWAHTPHSPGQARSLDRRQGQCGAAGDTGAQLLAPDLEGVAIVAGATAPDDA
jgi:hypothetical protein